MAVVSIFVLNFISSSDYDYQLSNVDHLDFSEISDRKPTQEFEVAQGRDVGEYHVMYV